MLIRNCTGGIVFNGDKVLMIENDKHEWAFPKGVIRVNQKLTEVVVRRVKLETGVDAKVVAPCGKTHYEFYSITRRKPVHNNISWFIMKSDDVKPVANKEENILNAKFFDIQVAMEKVTYSQDKSLLLMAYQKYKELG
ncbi:MAG: NUDIX domain-containing protein [Saccharofermentans sp.]|jgi:ADP-ribose pyrophosphatase YjhB (NUDIX family)|nr:NUDIX domain-containing protein [Clostridiales bacterium]MBP3809882.1 NUDIX domain-containing protein [Clostridiales bacterium]MBR4494774.1 NUDIX domain-containing protein [Clostridiales bacterium]MCR5047728.1 NUDIX domain-containing protein [Saccharofermentans sp.]